jgi:hypothetical protein
MKKRKIIKSTLVGLLLLIVATGCGKKEENPESQTSEATPQNSEQQLNHWERFSSEAGKFSILFPRLPKERDASFQTPFGESELFSFIAEVDKQNVFAAAYFDYPARVDLTDTKKVFALTLNQFVKSGYEVDSQAEEQFGNYPGMQFEIGKGDLKVTEKQILVGRRLYQISSVFAAENPHPQEIAAFFNSFSIQTNKP